MPPSIEYRKGRGNILIFRAIKIVWSLIIIVFLLPLAYSWAESQNTCLKCHPDKVEEASLPVQHAPFKKGNCQGCHNPHAARYELLLLWPQDKLCVPCHTKEMIAGKGLVHEPVKKGECLSCHLPHAASYLGLLKESGNTLCFSCHEAKEFQGTFLHSPVAHGKCYQCHNPHSSNNVALLKQEPSKICQECHPAGKSLVVVHLGFPMKNSNCLTCHSAHVSKNKGLLKPVVHEPFARGDCQSCHTKGINLKGDLTSLCTRCHKQIKETFLKIQSHLVTGKESCNSCHTPHASDDRGLLIRAKEKLCFSCHWDTRDRMAAKKGNKPHPLAGKGCFECHAGHGSNQPFLLHTDGVQVCTGCHRTQGKFTHPVGEEIRDPRNQLPVGCTTCHDTKYSKYAAYLRLPEERLCLQCHYRGK